MGKTSLILALYDEFRLRGFGVAVIKHSEHSIIMDQKDTDMFLKDGIADVTFWGKDGFVSYHNYAANMDELLSQYIDYDIVIIEGAKHMEALPKIWLGTPDDKIKNIIAIITSEEGKWNIPTFEKEDISSLVSYLLSL